MKDKTSPLLIPIGCFGAFFVGLVLKIFLIYATGSFILFKAGKHIHEKGAKDLVEQIWEGPSSTETVTSVSATETPTVVNPTMTVSEDEAPTSEDKNLSGDEDQEVIEKTLK